MSFDTKKRWPGIFPRTWIASARDTYLLLNEFHGPVLFFSITIICLGIIYFLAAAEFHEPLGSIAEAIYLMLTLTFLQLSGNFPKHPILQSLFFLMPIIGVGTLARGLADFGMLLFNRRSRSKEWEMAVASTFHDHTVLIGLGHLGFRVVQKLHEMKEPVVVFDPIPLQIWLPLSRQWEYQLFKTTLPGLQPSKVPG